MRLKQELATTAELVSAVLKREQLKRETTQHANCAGEAQGLLQASSASSLRYSMQRRTKSCFTTRRGSSRRSNKQSNRTCYVFPDEYGTYGHFSRIWNVKLKSHNPGDLASPELHHDAVVRPKERAVPILAQVDREMARIKERDHHWEDGIEVSLLRTSTLFLNTSP